MLLQKGGEFGGHFGNSAENEEGLKEGKEQGEKVMHLAPKECKFSSSGH